MTTPENNERDYVAEAAKYASDIVLGHVPASALTRLACQRYIDDLKRTDRGEWAYRVDDFLSCRVCRFVEKFPAVKGGRGLLKLTPWQVFVLVNIYGWVDEEGLRRFRTAYIEVTKKQGKSSLAAPLCLYALCMDGEEGAEVYTAAVDRGQAKIVWDIAKQMAQRTPTFRERYNVTLGAHALFHHPTGSTFMPLSRDGKSLEGKNPSFVIVDELHRHKTREIWDILDESRGARAQSLMIAITNSGSDKASICYEQRTYLLKILNGYDDPTYFGLIYTIDDEDIKNWDDELVWAKAQPSLGTTVKLGELRRLANKAHAMPSARASFMRYQLGVWSEGEHAWMPGYRWDPCANPSITEESMRGKKCMVALDLASKIDVAAMVAVFRVKAAAKVKYIMIPRFYVPESRIKSNDSYYGWEKDGWLIKTPGDTIDFSMIETDLLLWHEMFDIVNAPYDRFQATQFATRMTELGVPMIQFSQTVGMMSEPMKEMEKLVIEKTIEHNANPMMDWMISNVFIQPDRKDNIYPRKEREENKIDGPVAAIMGMAMWVGQKPGPKHQIMFVGK